MQSRFQSVVETVASVGVGFVLSMIVGHFVYPHFGMKVTVADNAGITAIFTITSLIRSYYTRRFFNWLHTRK